MNDSLVAQKTLGQKIMRDWRRNKTLYFLFLPVFAFIVVFSYVPMFGIIMAFEKFSFSKGFFGSEFIGLGNFIKLFSGDEIGYVMRNTTMIALINLTIGFIMPILFALMISSVKVKWFKRGLQSMSYMPNFVAAVVICTLLTEFVSVDGAVTQLICKITGMEPQNLLAINSPAFWFLNLLADTWQGLGYASIVFVSAIANINPNLNEAAVMDGASKFARLKHITLPSILPLIIMMFVMKMGLVFKTGFDKVLLLYSPSVYEYADNIITYTYRYSFGTKVDYGLSSASGLLQSVICLILILVSNWLSKKLADTSLL